MLRCRQSLPLALMRTSITKGSELNATGNRRQLMRTPKLLTLRATPGEWGWSRQTMCPLDQPNKSSARNLSSRATSGAGGASCEHESLPGYGGMCFQCKKVHWIPRTRQVIGTPCAFPCTSLILLGNPSCRSRFPMSMQHLMPDCQSLKSFRDRRDIPIISCERLTSSVLAG